MANLIPPASVYDDLGFFDITPYVTRGSDYIITGGATEIADFVNLTNGNCPPAIPIGDGLPHEFTACASGSILLFNGGDPAEPEVTATLEAVAEPPTPPAQVDPQELVTASRCFECLSPATQEEIQTLIIATAAGLSTDPNELIALSRCMSCLSYQTLLEIKAFLLASHGGLSTDPNVRAQESRCYSCIPQGYLSTVQTYLLSQDTASPSTDPQTLAGLVSCWSCVPHPTLLEIQVYLLARMYDESTDPNVLAGLARCFSCLPFPVLQYTLTQIIDEIEGDGGGGIVGCTDDPPQLIPVLVGTYMAGELTSVEITLPKVCCDPDHVALYEADAADGTGAVAYLNVAVGNSHSGESNLVINVPIIIPLTKDYLVAKQVCGDATESAFSNGIVTEDAGFVAASDWADRVETNGGVRPSNASINAAATFYNSLSTAGILSKMYAVNIIAPDNLTAARTPLIKVAGSDPWVNQGPFVGGDLTVNGLVGNGVNKALRTGATPSTFMNPASASTSIYVYDKATGGGFCGAYNNITGKGFIISTAVFDCWNNATERILHNTNLNGFYLGTRTAANDSRVFFANSTNPWAQKGVTNNGGDPAVASEYYTHSLTGAFFSDARISFVGIHQGLSSPEGESLFNAVQALRTAFGGGFI